MTLKKLEVQGYRSIRDLSVTLGRINVFTGPNGCGKSNLYRALRLVAAAADGRFARTLAQEGGLASALWAGIPVLRTPIRMRIALHSEVLSYEMSCGLPSQRLDPDDDDPSMFNLDPEIKEEHIWAGPFRRPSTTVCMRDGKTVQLRDREDALVTHAGVLDPGESVLSQILEPERFPDSVALRLDLQSWRFYHEFRTDAHSPLRQPQLAVRTPALADDGSDLASALRTIHELGDQRLLYGTIEEAFPGSHFTIAPLYSDTERPAAPLALQFRPATLPRYLNQRELSDGTLRFFCLVAALLTPRPPQLLALNEPEMSLHPDLLPALARLIVGAAEHTQLWITTHSTRLAELIAAESGVQPIRMELAPDGTRISSHLDAEE